MVVFLLVEDRIKMDFVKEFLIVEVGTIGIYHELSRRNHFITVGIYNHRIY